MQPSFVTFENVCKYYQNGGVRIAAADHVSFTIEQGEFCIIVGALGRRQGHCDGKKLNVKDRIVNIDKRKIIQNLIVAKWLG